MDQRMLGSCVTQSRPIMSLRTCQVLCYTPGSDGPWRERAMKSRRLTQIAGAAIALTLVAAACGDGGDDETETDVFDLEVEEEEPEEFTDAEMLELVNDMTDDEFDEFVDGLSGEEYGRLEALLEGANDEGANDEEPNDDPDGDPDGDIDDAAVSPGASASTRDDIDCSAEGLGADDTFAFTTAHYIVDGALGAVCFGDPDQRVVDAWDSLATIAPSGQLADLGVFGGFEASEGGDEVTLAFVNPLDDDGSLFQMSINLDSYVEDPNEAQLTMAHEFAHVFTLLPSQVDRTVEAIDNCSTYYNGEGCYADDSIMFQWINEFWDDGLIDQVDPEGEATAEVGQDRCDNDAGFFGAYAASTPEEDFAESFSAYVFAIEVASDEQQERVDWIAAQPGLAEYRERAEAAGVTGVTNNFDECGLS